MSDPSPDAYPAGFGPVRAPSEPVWRTETDALRHAIMLQRCFDGPEMRWSDALIARMRRHLGGCLTSVAMRIRMEIERISPVPMLTDAHCWLAVQRRPTLISLPLLDHFRDRAALSLMRQDQLHAMPAEADGGDAPMPPELVELLATIALAQAGWADAGPDASPMRADLPAELMAEMVWTVAAVLLDALIAGGNLAPARAMAVVEQAGVAVLAGHDEQTMPFAMAALLAHRARALGMGEAGLLGFARGRHILPLLAILADRTGIELLALTRAAVEEHERILFLLCRAAEFPREVAVRLVLGRRCVARGVDDSMLVQFADGYDGMGVEAARDAVAAMRLPEPLRVRHSSVHDRIDPDGG